MGAKRFLAFAGVSISAILLAVFLIATAPAINCFLGRLLFDKWHIVSYDGEIILVYNWSLGLIAFAMSISMIIMFIFKKMRLYACLLIPYILSLIIVMIYAGMNIDYLGDGFVEIRKNLFSNRFCYKNRKGKTIIKSKVWLTKLYHNDKIVFADNSGIGPNILYNEYGKCFLKTPADDNRDGYPGILLYNDFYYTQKHFYDDDGRCDSERIRFFDIEGNYVVTRMYGAGEFNPKEDIDSGIYFEYLEKVEELADGVKEFKTE